MPRPIAFEPPSRLDDLPELDERLLGPLKQQRPDFHRRLVQAYLRHSPTLVASLADAARRGDVVAINRAAHSLRSSSANIGASRLAALLAALEQATLSGEATDLVPAIDIIVAAFARVRDLIAADMAEALEPPVAHARPA